MEITENPRVGDFILSIANGTLSLENGVLSAGDLKAGTVVSKLSGNYVQLDPDAETGAETAVGVLMTNADASTAAQAVVVVARQAEVKADGLIWPAGITTEEKTAALQSLASIGVFAR